MNIKHALAMICTTALVSCDDPKKIQQSNEQKQQIARLQGELEYLNEKLQLMPKDRSQELANAKKQLDEKERELSEITEKAARAKDDFLRAKDEWKKFQNAHPMP